MSFGPAAWVYGSEVGDPGTSCKSNRMKLMRTQIFPTSVRARGLNFSASGGAIGSIIVAQVWPVGTDQIGSRIYFFFFAVNVACVPVSS